MIRRLSEKKSLLLFYSRLLSIFSQSQITWRVAPSGLCYGGDFTLMRCGSVVMFFSYPTGILVLLVLISSRTWQPANTSIGVKDRHG